MHCPLTMHTETQVSLRIWMKKYFYKCSSVIFEVVICWKGHSCCWMVFWGSSTCNITPFRRSMCLCVCIYTYTYTHQLIYIYIYVFMTGKVDMTRNKVFVLWSVFWVFIYMSYHTFCATAIPRRQVHLLLWPNQLIHGMLQVLQSCICQN